MEKLKKMAKWLDRVMGFFYRVNILFIVLSVLVIFGFWYLWLGSPALIEQVMTQNMGIVLKNIAPERYAGLFQLIYLTVGVIGDASLMCMMFYSFRGILTPIRDGLPFHDDIVYYLKRLSVLVLAQGGLGLVSAILRGTAHSLMFLFYGAVLYMLSCIFQYGGELQQLSDETL